MYTQLLVFLIGANLASIHGCMPPKERLFSFFDASAKIPSGIMSGNLGDLGAFDQCLALDEPVNDIRHRGQYCVVKVPLPPGLMSMKSKQPNEAENRAVISATDQGTLGLILGWCISDQCPPENITQTIRSMIPEVAPNLYSPDILGNLTIYPFAGGLCQTQEAMDKEATTFSGADIGAIAFLSLILAIMILSTAYDMFIRYRKQKPYHIIFIAFSVRTNGEKLLAVSQNPDQLPCLHGIRFISMMWVLYGHRFGVSYSEPNINVADISKWKADPLSMYVIGATVSVDSFFLLSGLLVCYGFLLAKAKGVQFSVIKYWIHRYIRLTPALAVVILVVATIANRLGTGPFWPFAALAVQGNCQKNWWPIVLYIQNYYTVDVCLKHTWYLAIDTQLFILSPLILIPLWRWPKYTLYACLALVFGCMIAGFVVSYHYDLPANSLADNASIEYGNQYYVPTHIRYGPWLMGIMMGYYIFTLKKRNDTSYKLHPTQVVAGWILALTLFLTVLFAPHGTLTNHDRIANAFFNGLHKHVWALALCWVVYACTQGYGGPINAFLSWSLFQVLGRFTYTMYLLHAVLQQLIIGTDRTNTYFTDFNNMYKYWGDFFLTLAIAICLTLSFESPMLAIEKVIFGMGAPKKANPSKPKEVNGQAKQN